MIDNGEQPDGIEDTSFDLPDPARAAARVNEFLSAWGDGLIPLEYDGLPPLYARDLQALTNLVATEQTYEWGTRDRRGLVHSVGVENETQARSMLSMTPVRRQVGPWLPVSEEATGG